MLDHIFHQYKIENGYFRPQTPLDSFRQWKWTFSNINKFSNSYDIDITWYIIAKVNSYASHIAKIYSINLKQLMIKPNKLPFGLFTSMKHSQLYGEKSERICRYFSFPLQNRDGIYLWYQYYVPMSKLLH